MASWQKEQKGPFLLPVAALPSLLLSQSYARAGVWLCSGHTHPYVHLFQRSHGKREGPGPDTSVGWRRLGKTRSWQEPLHKGLYTCVSMHQEGRPAAEAGRKPTPADRAQPPRSRGVVSYIASWPVMSTCHKQRAILTGGQSLMCVHSAVVTQVLCTVTLFT